MAFLLLLLAPLDCILLILVISAEIAGRVGRWLRPVLVPEFPPCRMECSCVMVTWHGRQALMQSLPTLTRAFEKHGGNHEIIVVIDHESGDGSEQYVRTEFPEIKVIVATRSLFFGAATRLGVRTATRDIVVLVNNDMVVQQDFLAPLIDAFHDRNIFGAAAQVRDCSSRHHETGKTSAKLRSGKITWTHDTLAPLDHARRFCEVSWLHRGVFAFDRRKYHCLGSLDDMYDPLYFEDADLSLRAWKLGWKCLLSVNSWVSHPHRQQMPDAGRKFLQTILQRNAYIFFWKNVANIRMLACHFCLGTWRRFIRGRNCTDMDTELHALLGALKRLPRILRQRIRMARMSTQYGRECESAALGLQTWESVSRGVR
jgi:GT2 family glycosyltransferase